jgi:hypothetical protein
MPVVAAVGDAVETGNRAIDRQDRRIERHNPLTRRRSLLVGLPLVALIAAAGTATWVGLFRDLRFAEPPCRSAAMTPQRAGCVATVPSTISQWR